MHIALTLALVESFGLALLLSRVRGVHGMPLLVTFLVGVGVWVLSCELTTWFGPGVNRIALALVAFSSLTSAVFFHFTLVLCDVPRRREALVPAYVLAGAATVFALLVPPGHFEQWRNFESFFVPNAVGWTVGTVWMVLSAAGHLVLLHAWWHRHGPPRGQLVAMCMASAWGALCMSGYGFIAIGIDLYPFPLLFLPLYPLILVFGILRYELMIVNTWARRGLAWGLLVGVGSALVGAIAALPIPFGEPSSGWRLWLLTMAAIVVAAVLLDPFRRLATRLVYPGSHVGEDDVVEWKRQLSVADSFERLRLLATEKLSQRLRVPVKVAIGERAQASSDGAPTVVCASEGGKWAAQLVGWDAAPPGPRYVAQLFGSVVAEVADQLAQAMALAARERDRQKQERLAELGALAATVAHDIRNPLNIIGMAAASAPADARKEISIQTARISQLAADLLDYASSWKIEPRDVDLGDLVQTCTARHPEIELGAGLQAGLRASLDARRLTQALTNLVENARAAINGKERGRILVDATQLPGGLIELSVSDNGSGVPAEIRHNLFQPFVSRRPDGTGLGLAIVAKIMEAHGGSARLGERPDWATTFVLTFPAAAPS